MVLETTFFNPFLLSYYNIEYTLHLNHEFWVHPINCTNKEKIDNNVKKFVLPNSIKTYLKYRVTVDLVVL